MFKISDTQKIESAQFVKKKIPRKFKKNIKKKDTETTKKYSTNAKNIIVLKVLVVLKIDMTASSLVNKLL